MEILRPWRFSLAAGLAAVLFFGVTVKALQGCLPATNLASAFAHYALGMISLSLGIFILVGIRWLWNHPHVAMRLLLVCAFLNCLLLAYLLTP